MIVFKTTDTMRLIRPIYTLLSYNVLCGSFWDPIPQSRFLLQTEKIRKLRPDIVCLQEFNNVYVENIYRKELSSDYHFLLHRISKQEIARRLLLCSVMITISYIVHPTMAIVCTIATINPYIHNFIVGTQKTGNIILLHKSHPITSVKTKEFERQDGDILNWIRKRGYIDIMFYDILIRNTHLSHGKDPIDDRQKQIDECIDDKCKRMLLVGDFNTEKVSRICENGFKDCSGHLGYTYRKENPLTVGLKCDKKIDYIFSQGVEVIQTTKLDVCSDHDGFIIRFQ